MKPGLHKAKTLADIPESVPVTHRMGKLKSWADYTKKERRERYRPRNSRDDARPE